MRIFRGRLGKRGGILAGVVFGLLPSTIALAGNQTFYSVVVDTSTISGTTGFLDFQFVPSSPLSQFAFAEILNFQGGSLMPPPSIVGDVSGILPGILVLNNDTPANSYSEGFIFGQNILFDLLLAGPAVSNPGPLPFSSIFGFGVLNSAGVPELTSSPTAQLFTVSVNPGGTTTVDTSSPFVIVTPEPASVLLFFTVVAAIGLIFGRRAKFLFSKS
jgi:hypothetical protein